LSLKATLPMQRTASPSGRGAAALVLRPRLAWLLDRTRWPKIADTAWHAPRSRFRPDLAWVVAVRNAKAPELF